MINRGQIEHMIHLVGSGHMDEIDVSRTALLPDDDVLNNHLNKLKKILKEREINREKYRGVNIVSLGENCISRTIPTRWGMIDTKKNGRASMVFDLAVHPGEAVGRLLENNFKDYLNKEYLFFDSSSNIWKHRKYNVLFNHDKDIAEGGADKLITRYSKRIDNFYKALSSSENLILLFSIIKSNTPGDIEKLFELVKTIRQNGDFYLAVFNHLNSQPPITLGSKNIIFIDNPFPKNDYKWWMPNAYLSDDGLQFEKTYIDYLKAICANITI